MDGIILGIDPGTRVTGYGVVAVTGGQVSCVDYGVIAPPNRFSLAKRVGFINQGLENLYQTHHPCHTAIEKVFFGKNPEVAFKLGHIFALCLLQSQKNGSEFFEYSARFIKKSITSSGRASKEWTRQFVNNVFSLKEQKALDATDALAVALCHCRELQALQIQSKILESAG
ncbi:MAG: crossover junction endodeoxyribonuclease RuvC [Bdellovibrionales bacterium]|nr:crossover junction endodeoxyribonuclease RuvC [Bdellovibrionales bacterium]